MELIKRITDKDILGTDGISLKPPRYTARAILQNSDGLYALMYAADFHLYSLPGGGIESGEDVLDALKREILEETGCHYDHIAPLGYVEENRAHQDYTTISYYFAVTTDSLVLQPDLTEEERRHGTIPEWHSLADMIHRIRDIAHPTVQRRFIQARDMAALEYYCKTLAK